MTTRKDYTGTYVAHLPLMTWTYVIEEQKDWRGQYTATREDGVEFWVTPENIQHNLDSGEWVRAS